jgi:hypothetical protein
MGAAALAGDLDEAGVAAEAEVAVKGRAAQPLAQ